MNFVSLFSGLLLGYSLAMPPGPMNTLIVAWSLRSIRHGFAVGAGAMSADFLFMLLTLYGVLSGLGGGQFFAPFHAAGGLFFLYLAYKIGTAKPPREGSAGGGAPAEGLPPRPLAGAHQPLPSGSRRGSAPLPTSAWSG